jgi:hypothetical protein
MSALDPFLWQTRYRIARRSAARLVAAYPKYSITPIRKSNVIPRLCRTSNDRDN